MSDLAIVFPPLPILPTLLTPPILPTPPTPPTPPTLPILPTLPYSQPHVADILPESVSRTTLGIGISSTARCLSIVKAVF